MGAVIDQGRGLPGEGVAARLDDGETDFARKRFEFEAEDLLVAVDEADGREAGELAALGLKLI